MLLELPNLAHNAFDPRRRTSTVSRAFRRQIDHFDRQVFNGPPEHTRDFVMSASQLVLDGKWQKAAETLAKLPAWELLPDPEHARTFIRTQLISEGLRAFLISSYAHFETISLKGLAARFSIPESDAHAIVSRMLLSNELHACWDQPTATLAVQRTEPSKLQFLSLQFAEKTAQFVEANELLLDTRSSSYWVNRDDRRVERDGGYPRDRRPWVERGDRYRDRDGGGYFRGGRAAGGFRMRDRDDRRERAFGDDRGSRGVKVGRRG
jgi:translation initiation factor 3 subunit C